MDPMIVKITDEGKYQRLLPGVPETRGMKSGRVILAPGESVGEHVTDSKEEAILILEGEAEIYCEGDLVGKAGDNTLVYMPPEKKHDIKNSGVRPLKYVYVVSPA